MTATNSKFILVHKIKTFGSGSNFKAYQDKTLGVLIRIEDINRIEEVERYIEHVPHVFTCIFFNNDNNVDTDENMLVKESIEEMYEKLKNTVVLEKTEDL